MLSEESLKTLKLINRQLPSLSTRPNLDAPKQIERLHFPEISHVASEKVSFNPDHLIKRNELSLGTHCSRAFSLRNRQVRRTVDIAQKLSISALYTGVLANTFRFNSVKLPTNGNINQQPEA